MEIGLIENKFTVKYEDVEFIFANSTRSFVSILQGIGENAGGVLKEYARKDLLEIKNLKIAGRPAVVEDFEFLPQEIYLAVVAGYEQRIVSRIQEVGAEQVEEKKPSKKSLKSSSTSASA